MSESSGCTTIGEIQQLLGLSDETVELFRKEIRIKERTENTLILADRMIEEVNSNMSPDILRALLAQLASLV